MANEPTVRASTLRQMVAEAKASPCLVHIYPSGPAIGKRYVLGGEQLLVGRDESCDICIPDESASRRHALVQLRDEGCFVTDLQSTNGTFVNNIRVQQAQLKDGDYLCVGNCIYRYLAGGNIEAQYHEEIYRMSIMDALTGAFNRRCLVESLERELSRALRYARPLAFLLLDLDRFKEVNDRLGHLGGDAALREVAAIIRSGLRRDDLFARYGGEEFAIILPETVRPAAIDVAERVRSLVAERQLRYDDKNYSLTISVGVSTTQGKENISVSDFVRRADDHLYQAKREGRNRVVA